MTETTSLDDLYGQIKTLKVRCTELEQAPFTATATHSGSIIVEANQAFADLVSYTRDELKGLNAWTLFPPESYPLLMQKLQTKSERPYEVMAQNKYGEPFMIEMYGTNHEYKGEPARTVHVRNISELHTLRQKLDQLEKDYKRRKWVAERA